MPSAERIAAERNEGADWVRLFRRPGLRQEYAATPCAEMDGLAGGDRLRGVLFFASGEARFVTGAAMLVYGGNSITKAAAKDGTSGQRDRAK